MFNNYVNNIVIFFYIYCLENKVTRVLHNMICDVQPLSSHYKIYKVTGIEKFCVAIILL